MQIDFDEKKHEYSVGGEKVPSVSEILSPLSAERYADLNPYMIRAAAARGTAIHEACEAIDYGLNPDISPVIVGYVKAYKQFLRDYSPKWEAIEKIVGYTRYADEKPLYCGTIDRYGTIDGKKALVDIKTYASLTTEGYLTGSCQTALYRDAMESNAQLDGIPDMVKGLDAYDDNGDVIRRYILHLKSDGDYRLVSLDSFDNERGFHSESLAWSLYNLYCEKQNAYRKVKKNGSKTSD